MRNRLHSRRGSSLLEGALFIPFLILLLLGMLEFGRVVYTYYQLQKTMYAFARFAGTQQNINFCDNGDAAYQQAVSLALTGTGDSTAEPLIGGLQATDFRVRIERYNETNQSLEQCDCSSAGCDPGQGGGQPHYIVVDLENGYPFTFRVPGLQTDPIQLRPMVRVPFGGT
jgi:Flp pilus assembly protein TadG